MFDIILQRSGRLFGQRRRQAATDRHRAAKKEAERLLCFHIIAPGPGVVMSVENDAKITTESFNEKIESAMKPLYGGRPLIKKSRLLDKNQLIDFEAQESSRYIQTTQSTIKRSLKSLTLESDQMNRRLKFSVLGR